MTSMNRAEALIVGGGAIGLSLAWELARRLRPVSVIQPEQERPAASWAGAGILPPAANCAVVDPYEQLKSLSHRLHGQWAQRLLEETGVDTGFRRCGGVYLATSRAEVATLTAQEYWWEQYSIEYQRLTTAELLKLEPQLSSYGRSPIFQSWLLPGECQLRNPRHLKALRIACQNLGVNFLSANIAEIRVDAAGQAELKSTQGDKFTADRICLCTGAWARQMLEQLNLPNGILPVRGQMVLYNSQRPILSRIVNEGHRYLVPRDDGHLLAGSVEEEVGYVIETTPEALEQIQNWACSVLPQLNHAQVVSTWAGLRPGSFDGLPYLGAVPGTRNLYCAAGHFRSGLHLACGTAQVMANLMLGTGNQIDLSPFRVGRG
ncbi:MAG: glycine oxidase ThiO [Pirellulaceae bacterium]|nr:glycine oxidase ThiO [Pirellulaceae bacterium]